MVETELFKKIILEFWENKNIIQRDIAIEEIDGKVTALVGSRRSGKTFYLFH